MPIMKHSKFGTQDAAEDRVEKLLKRGWKVQKEVEKPQTPEDLDDNKGES